MIEPSKKHSFLCISFVLRFLSAVMITVGSFSIIQIFGFHVIVTAKWPKMKFNHIFGYQMSDSLHKNVQVGHNTSWNLYISWRSTCLAPLDSCLANVFLPKLPEPHTATTNLLTESINKPGHKLFVNHYDLWEDVLHFFPIYSFCLPIFFSNFIRVLFP